MSVPPGIVWLGPVFDPSGYADEGRGILGALDQGKVPVALRPMERLSAGFREGLPPAERAMLDRLVAQPLPTSFALVQHVTADSFQRLGSAEYLVGRTMFETDSIPPTWVAPCNAMDELWLPSAFNAETFRTAGVTVPIHLVPGGIDSTTYHPDRAPLPVAGLRGTVFLSVFEWRLRKGWDVLLRAWAEAFSPTDDVTLVLRTYPIDGADSHDNLTIINEQMARYLQRSCGGRTRADVARIVVLPDKIAARDMPALYRIADAYVSPTRGEGWGRPFMEAMASGVPVIATRWSAHLEFLNDENGYLIDVDSIGPADGVEMPLYAQHRWANPSAAHLTQLMQRVHKDTAEARAIGAHARSDMVRDWPWSRAANVIRDRLRQLSGHQAFAPATTPAPTASIQLSARLFGGKVWQYPAEQLAAAVADFAGAACAIQNSVTDLHRPSWSDRARPAWHAMQRDRPQSADITITVLDREQPDEGPPPAHGAWIVYTGDVVADTIPREWVRTLRDHATDVWTPTPQAMDACLRAGVERARLWMVPFASPSERCPPGGPHMPIEATEGPVVLFPLFDAAQRADLACLLELWPKSALADTTATLVVIFPDDGTGVRPRDRDALLTLLARGTVEHGVPVRVSGRTPTMEETAAFVRSAALVITSTRSTVRADIVHRLAVLLGRPSVRFDAALTTAAQLSLADGSRAAAEGDEALSQSVSYGDMRAQVGARLSALLATDRSGGPRLLAEADAATVSSRGSQATGFLAFPDWSSGMGAGIVRSFCETFTTSDDVVLMLAEDPAQQMAREDILRMLDEAAQLAGRTTDDRPAMLLLPEPVSNASRESLLAMCDVVVGFDDPPLARSAQRMGIPMLHTLMPQAWRHCQAGAIRRVARPPAACELPMPS